MNLKRKLMMRPVGGRQGVGVLNFVQPTRLITQFDHGTTTVGINIRGRKCSINIGGCGIGQGKTNRENRREQQSRHHHSTRNGFEAKRR